MTIRLIPQKMFPGNIEVTTQEKMEQEARADPKALAGGMSSDYQVLPSHRLGFSNTL